MQMPALCQMFAHSTDICVNALVAYQRWLLLIRALPFIASQIEFIGERVERHAEVASGTVLLNRLSQTARRHGMFPYDWCMSSWKSQHHVATISTFCRDPKTR